MKETQRDSPADEHAIKNQQMEDLALAEIARQKALAELQKEIDGLYIKLEAANMALSKQKSIPNEQAVALIDAAIDELIDKQLELENLKTKN